MGIRNEFNWPRIFGLFFIFMLAGAAMWTCEIVYGGQRERRQQLQQETIDKCVEQTGDARFCWEKYG